MWADLFSNIYTWYVVVLLLILWLYREVYSTKLYFFYKDTCPYCKDIKEAWNKFTPECGWFQYKVYTINSAHSPQLADKFGVNKVPTIFKLNPDGSRVDFTGEHTMEALRKFAC